MGCGWSESRTSRIQRCSDFREAPPNAERLTPNAFARRKTNFSAICIHREGFALIGLPVVPVFTAAGGFRNWARLKVLSRSGRISTRLPAVTRNVLHAEKSKLTKPAPVGTLAAAVPDGLPVAFWPLHSRLGPPAPPETVRGRPLCVALIPPPDHLTRRLGLIIL